MGIAAEFSAILGDLANLSSLVTNVFNLGAKQDTAQSTLANTQVLIIGMAILQQQVQAMQAQLSAIQSNEANLQSNLGYQLSQVQLATQPVMLPTVAPSTFLDTTNGGTAAAIWQYSFSPFDFEMESAMTVLYTLGQWMRDSGGLPTRFGSAFMVIGDPFNQADYPWPSTPEWSSASILPTDASRIAWLNRLDATYGWSLSPSGLYQGHQPGWPAESFIWCTLSEEEFEWFREAAGGTLPGTDIPPVWPGVSKVTFGAPVAFSGSTLSVAGPMDGIVVSITSVPQPLPHYHYGTAEAWGRLGGLAFVDDDGQAEEYQLFGFVNAVFCPKAMKRAQSCQIRNLSGIVGTVTPWTKA